MELVMKGADDSLFEPAKDLLVVVACEDAANARSAYALLKRVGRNAGAEGRLISSWWTFSEISSASLNHLTTQDSAQADMLLIAAQEGPGLPEAVKNWIQRWVLAAGAPTRSRLLVALLEPRETEQGAARTVFQELKQVAELGWLDFLANGDEVHLDLPGVNTTVRHLSGARKEGARPEMPSGRLPHPANLKISDEPLNYDNDDSTKSISKP